VTESQRSLHALKSDHEKSSALLEQKLSFVAKQLADKACQESSLLNQLKEMEKQAQEMVRDLQSKNEAALKELSDANASLEEQLLDTIDQLASTE
jgi:tRNA splicing ligase